MGHTETLTRPWGTLSHRMGEGRGEGTRVAHPAAQAVKHVRLVIRPMSLLEIILRLVAVGLLTAYLVSRHRRRVAEAPLLPEDPSIWTGHGLDARMLQPRLEHVRRDYGAVLRGPPRPSDRPQGWRACAGRLIAGRGYFWHRPPTLNRPVNPFLLAADSPADEEVGPVSRHTKLID